MTRTAAFALLTTLAALAAGGCKKPPDDAALVQGEWTITAIDLPEGVKDRERNELNSMSELSVVVQGDRVTISHPKEKGGMAATFALDQLKTPKEIDVTGVTVTGEGPGEDKISGTTRGIYKLAGDELVVALPLGKEDELPRPTAFAAFADKESRRGVLVFHLKRK